MEYIEEYEMEGDNYVYVGDFILNIDDSKNDEITFTYVIGGHYLRNKDGEFVSYKEGTGIKYIETYKYRKSEILNTNIDGVNVDIMYDYIDIMSNTINDVYYEGLNLYRDAVSSKIEGMQVADVWSNDNATTSYVYKDETLLGLTNKPIHKIDVEIDRGGVSVNERHYKLSECNTFEDLINYGNGYFNVE